MTALNSKIFAPEPHSSSVKKFIEDFRERIVTDTRAVYQKGAPDKEIFNTHINIKVVGKIVTRYLYRFLGFIDDCALRSALLITPADRYRWSGVLIILCKTCRSKGYCNNKCYYLQHTVLSFFIFSTFFLFAFFIFLLKERC